MEKAYELVVFGLDEEGYDTDFAATIMLAPATDRGLKAIKSYANDLGPGEIKEELAGLGIEIPEEVKKLDLVILPVKNVDIIEDGSGEYIDSKEIYL